MARAAAVQRAVSELGRLDILVDNAGMGFPGPVLGALTEEWDRMLVNLQGLLYVTHAAVPHLLSAAMDSPRRVADLVNISSIGAGWPARGWPCTA